MIAHALRISSWGENVYVSFTTAMGLRLHDINIVNAAQNVEHIKKKPVSDIDSHNVNSALEPLEHVASFTTLLKPKTINLQSITTNAWTVTSTIDFEMFRAEYASASVEHCWLANTSFWRSLCSSSKDPLI